MSAGSSSNTILFLWCRMWSGERPGQGAGEGVGALMEVEKSFVERVSI